MNDINRKNAVYKMNSTKGIPYDSLENVEHNGSELNSIVINNALTQLADNDLIISNTIARLNDYSSGPKVYNEAQISAAPNGYKTWYNEANTDLSILRKIDKDLSESLVKTSLASQEIKFMFEHGNRLFVCTEEAANNLYFCEKVDGTVFQRITISGEKINNYCIHSGGILFACNSGIYALKTVTAVYNAAEHRWDDSDGPKYSLVSIEHAGKKIPRPSGRTFTAVSVNENTDTIYVGTSDGTIWSGFFVPTQAELNHVIFEQNHLLQTNEDGTETETHPTINNFGVLKRNSYTYDNDTVALTESGVYQTGQYANVLQNYHIFAGINCTCSIYVNNQLLIGTSQGIYTIDNENTPVQQFRTKITGTVTCFNMSDRRLYITSGNKIYVYSILQDSPYYQYITEYGVSTTIKKTFIYSTTLNGTVRTYIIVLTADGKITLLNFPNVNENQQLFPTGTETGTATDAILNPGSLVLYYVVNGKLRVKVLYGISSTVGNNMTGLTEIYSAESEWNKVNGNCLRMFDSFAVFPDKIFEFVTHRKLSASEIIPGGTAIVDVCELTTPLTFDTTSYKYIGLCKSATAVKMFVVNSVLTKFKVLPIAVNSSAKQIVNMREFVIVSTTDNKIYYANKNDLLAESAAWTQITTAGTPTTIAATFDYFWSLDLANQTLHEFSGAASQKYETVRVSDLDISVGSIIDRVYVGGHRVLLLLTSSKLYAIRIVIDGSSCSFISTSVDVPDSAIAHRIQFQTSPDRLSEIIHENIIYLSTSKGIYRYYLSINADNSPSITVPTDEDDVINAYPEYDVYGYIDNLNGHNYLLTHTGIYQLDITDEANEQFWPTPNKLINLAYCTTDENEQMIFANSSSQLMLINTDSDSIDIHQTIDGEFSNLTYSCTPNLAFIQKTFNDTLYTANVVESTSDAAIAQIIMTEVTVAPPEKDESDESTDEEHTESEADASPIQFKPTSFRALYDSDENIAYAISSDAISSNVLYRVVDDVAYPLFNIFEYETKDEKQVSLPEYVKNSENKYHAVHLDARSFDDGDWVLVVLVTDIPAVATAHPGYFTIKYRFSDAKSLPTQSYYTYQGHNENYASPHATATETALVGPDNEKIYFASNSDSVFYTNGKNLIQNIYSEYYYKTVAEGDDEFSSSKAHIEHKFDFKFISRSSTGRTSQVEASDVGFKITGNGQFYFYANPTAGNLYGIYELLAEDDNRSYEEDAELYDFETKSSGLVAYNGFVLDDIRGCLFYEGVLGIAQKADSTESNLYGTIYGTSLAPHQPEIIQAGEFDQVVCNVSNVIYIIEIVAGIKQLRSFEWYTTYNSSGEVVTAENTVLPTVVPSTSAKTITSVYVSTQSTAYIQYQEGSTVSIDQWEVGLLSRTGSTASTTINSPFSTTVGYFVMNDFMFQTGRTRLNTLNSFLGMTADDVFMPIYWIGLHNGSESVTYTTQTRDHIDDSSSHKTYSQVIGLRALDITEDGGVVGVLKYQSGNTCLYDIYADDDFTLDDADLLIKIASPSIPMSFAKVGDTYAFNYTGSWSIVYSGSLNVIPKLPDTYGAVAYTDVGIADEETVIATSKGIYKITYAVDYSFMTSDITRDSIDVFNSASTIRRLVGYSYGTDDVVVIRESIDASGCETGLEYSYDDSEFTAITCYLTTGDTAEIIPNTRHLFFDSNYNNSNTKLVIDSTNRMYYGTKFDNLFSYPDNSSLAFTINQVDTLNSMMYIFTNNGIYYTEGYKDVSKFILVDTISRNSCFTWHNVDNIHYFMTSNSGLKMITNSSTPEGKMVLSEVQAAVPPSPTYPVATYIAPGETTKTYLYPVISISGAETSIRYSRNARRWKKFIDLSKLKTIGMLTGIFVRNQTTYYIGTDSGLYMTKGSYDLTNDIKKLSEDQLNAIYQSPVVEAKFYDIFNTKLYQHTAGYHDGIMQKINSMVSCDFTGANLSEFVAGHSIGDLNPATGNDIVETCRFGSSSDNDIVVKSKGTIDGSSEHTVDFSYILKKSAAGVNELLVYIPTTGTYYLNHNGGTPHCAETSDSTQLDRKNFIGIYDHKMTSKMSSHATTFSISVPMSLCTISTTKIISVQANGNSLPLKVYIDHEHYDREGEAALMYHSFIEPTIYRGATSSGGNTVFSFAAFGSDAQAVRIMFLS